MGSFEIAVMLPLPQFGPARVTTRWVDLRQMALRAEAIGFDTVWTPTNCCGGWTARRRVVTGMACRWPAR